MKSSQDAEPDVPASALGIEKFGKESERSSALQKQSLIL